MPGPWREMMGTINSRKHGNRRGDISSSHHCFDTFFGCLLFKPDAINISIELFYLHNASAWKVSTQILFFLKGLFTSDEQHFCKIKIQSMCLQGTFE